MHRTTQTKAACNEQHKLLKNTKTAIIVKNANIAQISKNAQNERLFKSDFLRTPMAHRENGQKSQRRTKLLNI
jgi:hypothetical protein